MTEESKTALVRALVARLRPKWRWVDTFGPDCDFCGWKLPDGRGVSTRRGPSGFVPLEDRNDCAYLMEAFKKIANPDQRRAFTVGLITHAGNTWTFTVKGEEARKGGKMYLLGSMLLPPATVCECMARALGIEVGA
jgi:hypothetical protein